MSEPTCILESALPLDLCRPFCILAHSGPLAPAGMWEQWYRDWEPPAHIVTGGHRRKVSRTTLARLLKSLVDAGLTTRTRCGRTWLYARIPSLEDPADFRSWLASLPPDESVDVEGSDGIFDRYLREQGDPQAGLVEGPDGWQDYRAGGVQREVPGWAFYAYDFEFDFDEKRFRTGAEALAAFDAYWLDPDHEWEPLPGQAGYQP